MNREDFWQLVDNLVATTNGLCEFQEKLHAHLKSLSADEIEDFARHYAQLQNDANTTGVLEAAYIIGCGASNDGFIDFRRWIVFQGKSHFESIVADPDYLGTYDPNSDPIEQWYCEYHPMWANEEVGRDRLQHFEVATYPNASSDSDKPERLEMRYPKLWKRIQKTRNAEQSIRDRAKAIFLDATLDLVVPNNGSAHLVFNTGAEIRVRGYWAQYRTQYKTEGDAPCFDEHPLLGQTVVSVDTEDFPSSLSMWFANRKKLNLARGQDFQVFDNGTRVDA